MNFDNLIEEIIIDNLRNNKKFFYTVTGRNGSGKTTFLNKVKKEIEKDKNTFIFNLNSEIIIKNELKENKSQEEFKAQLRKYINNAFSKFTKIDENKEFEKAKKNVEDFLKKLEEIESSYFKKSFSNIFELDKNIKENSILIEVINTNDQPKDFSTGEGIFSLLLLLKNVLEIIESKDDEKILILIDEPEKFLHDSLVKKICNMFFELYKKSKNLYLIFSTHSSFLVNELVNLFKLHEKDFDENSRFKCLKFLGKNKWIDISEYLFNKENNTRELSIISRAVFDENIILVEGVNDFVFANLFLMKKFNDYFFNIYDCGGKNVIRKICSQILKFNKNVFCFFDKDYEKKDCKNAKEKSDEFRKYYDDENLFYFEFDDNIEGFLNLKKECFTNNIIIEKFDDKKFNDIKEKLEKFFKKDIDKGD